MNIYSALIPFAILGMASGNLFQDGNPARVIIGHKSERGRSKAKENAQKVHPFLRGLGAHERNLSVFSPPGLCKDGDQPFTVGAVTFQCEEEFNAKGGQCGTPNPTAEERARSREEFLQWKEMKDKQKPNGGNNGRMRRLGGCTNCIDWNTQIITVPVVFHIIHSGSSGREYTCGYDSQTGFTLPYSESNCNYVKNSIRVMNDGFRGRISSYYIHQGRSYSRYLDTDTKIQFCLDGTTTTDNTVWYNDNNELAMKQALDVGGMETLNVFVNLAGGYLGYAYFPGNNDFDRDGVVILNSAMPEGGTNNYEEGDTLTHEVGHWLNLEHTHAGGCSSGPGDYMNPACQESQATFGCPVNLDNCAGDGGPNPVHNFMSYVYDNCMDEFSPGQVPHLQQAWEDYRHKLGFSENVGLDTDGITCTTTGAGPSPVCGNNVKETGEQCDGTDLNGATCASLDQGFTGGTLACAGDCSSFDTNACTTAASPCNLASQSCMEDSDCCSGLLCSRGKPADRQCEGGSGVSPSTTSPPATGSCSSSDCMACEGGGACKDAGCTWNKGSCISSRTIR